MTNFVNLLFYQPPSIRNKKQKRFYLEYSINLNMTISLSTHHCTRISVSLKTKNSAVRKSFQIKALPIRHFGFQNAWNILHFRCLQNVWKIPHIRLYHHCRVILLFRFQNIWIILQIRLYILPRIIHF